MKRRGFFGSLLGLAALPFVPVKEVTKALELYPPQGTWIPMEEALYTWSCHNATTATSVDWTIRLDSEGKVL